MADDDSGVTEMVDQADGSRGIGAFAAGVIFGAFLGAGIALMFAPERGDKTRRRLRRRLQQLREDTAEGLERAGTRTRRDLARRKRRLEAGLERAAERARDAI
ncbi:MAG TPA: YtxH domain-containing protein [Gemmatimonadales bacterium]|nr:YtxH domain-containing protein [Gemmatimonadales bacterium]